MTIKLEVNEERTQRDLSEEEWSFPIWRWAAFSLFDTLILVVGSDMCIRDRIPVLT